MERSRSNLGRMALLMTGAFAGSSAMAQPSANAGAAAGGLIEEILVTAQRRSENLQEVPISITALTSDDIDTHRFRDPGDLSAQTPNMATSTVQGAGTPVFGLRGVSMNDWSFNQTGPVAVYLDEGYKGNPSLLAVPFFDLERVGGGGGCPRPWRIVHDFRSGIVPGLTPGRPNAARGGCMRDSAPGRSPN